MRVRTLIIALGLAAASPAFAQASDPKAEQNKTNWDIFQKLYPPRALAAHEEGAVGFKVTIDKKGLVTDCQVTQSSGHPLLDQETCTIITLHAEFQPEEGISGSQVRTREGMIAWKLPSSTTQLAKPTQVAEGSAPEKVICKKSIRTGTVGAVERTCMTQREWQKQSDEERDMWGDVQGKKGATHGN
jgi:TonB family protein